MREWISVKENPPERDRMVITAIYGTDMIFVEDGETLEEAVKRTRKEMVRVSMGFIGSDGWYGADGYPEIVTPSYWMPLPEPPKEEDDND